MNRALIVGLGMLALSQFITAGTYSIAGTGDSYTVATGLLVLGAISVVRGLYQQARLLDSNRDVLGAHLASLVSRRCSFLKGVLNLDVHDRLPTHARTPNADRRSGVRCTGLPAGFESSAPIRSTRWLVCRLSTSLGHSEKLVGSVESRRCRHRVWRQSPGGHLLS